MTKLYDKQDQRIVIEDPLPRKRITILGFRLLPILIIFALAVLLMKLF